MDDDGGEDENSQADPDYDPNNDEDDADESDDTDSDDDGGEEGDATEADNDETLGVDVEIPGVDDSDAEIPGVDDSEEDQNEDGETPGVNETEEEDESEQKEDEEEVITRASGSMNLRQQSRKRYDNKSLRKQSHAFNVIEETEHEGVMMLQIDPHDNNTFDTNKATTDVQNEMMDEKYVCLTEGLGWKKRYE